MVFWQNLPLRTRLALSYSLFFACTLAILSAGVYFTVRASLRREVAEQLRNNAALIQQEFDLADMSVTAITSDPTSFLRDRKSRIEGLTAPSLYVQVDLPNGMKQVSSTNIQNATLPLDSTDRELALAGSPQFSEIVLGGEPVMQYTRSLSDNGSVEGLLQVAHPLREINHTMSLLLWSMLLTDLFALVLAVRAGSWLAKRALEPVNTMATTADQIVRAEHLNQRVPQVPIDDEIGHLSRTFNEMLERLEQLFTAQQRFVADASHELRTPLAALQGTLDRLRRGALHDPATLNEALVGAEREVGRLVTLTNDLLTLDQAERGAPLRLSTVALDELVLEVVRELHPLAGELTLVPMLEEQIAITGDRDRIKQALINLVTNAIRHTPAGGRVMVKLARCNNYAELSVADTGEGIAPDDLPHIFERFYRADSARSRAAGGAGLGLTIVQWIATAHGGHVVAQSSLGRGSTFTVQLPLS